MRTSLLPLLYCPSCSKRLRLTKRFTINNGQIISGSLICRSAHRWPITGGIPRFTEYASRGKSATQNRFGDQWTKLSAFSFEKDDLRQFLGWIRPVKPSFFRHKVVLDAGCGAGRHLLITSAFKPKMIIGTDISRSVEVAFTKTGRDPKVHIIQADLQNLPFQKPFDYIYSVGVLHHLPDPRMAFRQLSSHLKTQGAISIWVYGKEGNQIITRFINPLRLGLTSRLPVAVLFSLCLPVSLFLFVLTRTINSIPLQIAKLLPLRAYLKSLSHSSFRKIFVITYDHLNAPVAHYLSREDLRSLAPADYFKTTSVFHRLKSGWCLFAQR